MNLDNKKIELINLVNKVIGIDNLNISEFEIDEIGKLSLINNKCYFSFNESNNCKLEEDRMLFLEDIIFSSCLLESINIECDE